MLSEHCRTDIPRDEAEGIIGQYSLSLRRIIALV